MAIVKMKRLRLVGMQTDRDILLRRLMALGCVELTAAPQAESGSSGDQGSRLFAARELASRLERAMKILKKYAPEKGGLFAERDLVSSDALFGSEVIFPAAHVAEELIIKEEQMQRLGAVIDHAQAGQAALMPWKDLDVPLNTGGTEHTAVLFGTVPPATDLDQLKESLAEAAPESALYKVGEGLAGLCLMVICHRAAQSSVTRILRQAGFQEVSFEQTGTAPDSLTALSYELEVATAELAEAKEEIAALKDRWPALKLCADRVAQEVALEEAKEKLRATEATFTLEGWFEAPREAELAALLDEFSCTWEQSDPTPAEYPEVPVKLKGNKLTEPLNMVTEMYGLPAYDGIDPNGLIMPFFAIFFGLMYADLGYGLVLFFLALFMRRKRLGRGMKNAMNLLLQVSITTTLFGVLFGSFFGDALPVFSETFLTQRIEPWLLLDPMADPILFMVGALALGGVQLLVGMGVRAYMCFRDNHPLDALFDVGTWWLLFAGIGVLVLGHGPWVLVAGVVSIILFQGRRAPTIAGKLFGGLGKLCNIVTYLGDVLSYIRLMALFLATGVIASVFNMLGSMLGEGLGHVFGIIGFLLVFLIGHAFNMSINIIGTYVHAIRLQYLEFFGKFYKEGGRPFKPFAIQTKYYDITS